MPWWTGPLTCCKCPWGPFIPLLWRESFWNFRQWPTGQNIPASQHILISYIVNNIYITRTCNSPWHLTWRRLRGCHSSFTFMLLARCFPVIIAGNNLSWSPYPSHLRNLPKILSWCLWLSIICKGLVFNSFQPPPANIFEWYSEDQWMLERAHDLSPPWSRKISLTTTTTTSIASL